MSLSPDPQPDPLYRQFSDEERAPQPRMSPPVIQGLRYSAGGLRAQASHLDGTADQLRIEAARLRHLATDLDARADVLDEVATMAQSEHVQA